MSKKILALILALCMLLPCLAACGEPSSDPSSTTTLTDPADDPTDKPDDSGDEPSGSDAPLPEKHPTTDNIKDGQTVYNVIFALATVPPVLAALDAIGNGYETYAIIERGKTYNGIANIETFHNVGFDPANNKSNGFTSAEFNAMVEQVKALKEATPDAFFNIYVQDGTALIGAAIAANAGVSAENFHVFMGEDGTGAYVALERYLINRTVTADEDKVYDYYLSKVNEQKEVFESIMAKTDNALSDAPFRYNIDKAFALASLDNFTYWLQDESIVIKTLDSHKGDVATKLYTCFGIDGYSDAVDVMLNLKYQKISEGVSKLSEEKRDSYLTLMYGQYFEATYENLTRAERAGEKAPADKLVFIGARSKEYPKLASDKTYGIGGLEEGVKVPATYAELDAKYKTPLLFPTEADYTSFLAILNDAENYDAGITDDVKELVKAACFNVYIDYIFTLKLTYALYGERYDIIMKGHPREVIGEYTEWSQHYKVTYGEENKSEYTYDKLIDKALLGFHSSDSVGKFIGMVPYGTSAENLAYLGANISLTGLPSSTYSGYDTDVEILSIFCLTHQDITGTDSQVAARYEAGNLFYTDKDGNRQVTEFLNLGNIIKKVESVLRASGKTELADSYKDLFGRWIAAAHPDAKDINAQGIPVK